MRLAMLLHALKLIDLNLPEWVAKEKGTIMENGEFIQFTAKVKKVFYGPSNSVKTIRVQPKDSTRIIDLCESSVQGNIALYTRDIWVVVVVPSKLLGDIDFPCEIGELDGEGKFFNQNAKTPDTVPSESDERTTNNVVRHEYRVLSESEKRQMKDVKDMGAELLDYITGELPSSRETSLAKTKVEEAVMWAVKGITS